MTIGENFSFLSSVKYSTVLGPSKQFSDPKRSKDFFESKHSQFFADYKTKDSSILSPQDKDLNYLSNDELSRMVANIKNKYQSPSRLSREFQTPQAQYRENIPEEEKERAIDVSDLVLQEVPTAEFGNSQESTSIVNNHNHDDSKSFEKKFLNLKNEINSYFSP